MCARVARSIPEINERIKRGEVVVLTAEEFKKEVREGATDILREVDVVTTATCGLMSGTAAIFSLEVAQRGSLSECSVLGSTAFLRSRDLAPTRGLAF